MHTRQKVRTYSTFYYSCSIHTIAVVACCVYIINLVDLQLYGRTYVLGTAVSRTRTRIGTLNAVRVRERVNRAYIADACIRAQKLY